MWRLRGRGRQSLAAVAERFAPSAIVCGRKRCHRTHHSPLTQRGAKGCRWRAERGGQTLAYRPLPFVVSGFDGLPRQH
jgi:hypothetical protein